MNVKRQARCDDEVQYERKLGDERRVLKTCSRCRIERWIEKRGLFKRPSCGLTINVDLNVTLSIARESGRKLRILSKIGIRFQHA